MCILRASSLAHRRASGLYSGAQHGTGHAPLHPYQTRIIIDGLASPVYHRGILSGNELVGAKAAIQYIRSASDKSSLVGPDHGCRLLLPRNVPSSRSRHSRVSLPLAILVLLDSTQISQASAKVRKRRSIPTFRGLASLQPLMYESGNMHGGECIL